MCLLVINYERGKKQLKGGEKKEERNECVRVRVCQLLFNVGKEDSRYHY